MLSWSFIHFESLPIILSVLGDRRRYSTFDTRAREDKRDIDEKRTSIITHYKREETPTITKLSFFQEIVIHN